MHKINPFFSKNTDNIGIFTGIYTGIYQGFIRDLSKNKSLK